MRISEKIKRFFKFSLMTLIIAGGGLAWPFCLVIHRQYILTPQAT